MRKLVLMLVVGLSIVSCRNKSISTSREGIEFEVEFLFEKDGVKVYRFYDNGRTHYYTNQGETITTHSSNKNQYEENIK